VCIMVSCLQRVKVPAVKAMIIWNTLRSGYQSPILYADGVNSCRSLIDIMDERTWQTLKETILQGILLPL
jgi:hypothetical protein